MYFVHKNDKNENPIFQLWESKTCLISTLNKCRIMFAPDGIFWNGDTLLHVKMATTKKKEQFFTISYKIYMENCEAMRSSTHSFAYSYQLFKICFVENHEQFKISYLPNFLSVNSQIFTVLLIFTPSIQLTSASWTEFKNCIQRNFARDWGCTFWTRR